MEHLVFAEKSFICEKQKVRFRCLHNSIFKLNLNQLNEISYLRNSHANKEIIIFKSTLQDKLSKFSSIFEHVKQKDFQNHQIDFFLPCVEISTKLIQKENNLKELDFCFSQKKTFHPDLSFFLKKVFQKILTLLEIIQPLRIPKLCLTLGTLSW